MIEKLTIRNFKSIKELEIDCKKINLFIGEPNTGKSNLLETLGLLSWCGHAVLNPCRLGEYIRLQVMPDLFYDGLVDQDVRIETTSKREVIISSLAFKEDSFEFERDIEFLYGDEHSIDIVEQKEPFCFNYYGQALKHESVYSPEFGFIKFYKFKGKNEFPKNEVAFLLPPSGSNLFSVVMAHRKLRETMSPFFKNFGFKLVLKPHEKVFEIQKQVDDLVFTYPYILTSDTLQRIIFHVIAMESNQNSTLVFEEPESHAFPYYTKYLGEKIAFDETNQYFIATHNPYLLNAIIEKAPKDSVNVFVCYFQDYQTKVKCLSKSQLSELLDFDPFFNLKAFIGEEEK